MSTGGGGLLDEYNKTNVAMESLLGVQQSAMYSSAETYFNSTIFWTKQDLPYVPLLDTVKLTSSHRYWSIATNSTPLAVKGQKSIFSVNKTDPNIDILAIFSSDGFPAASRRKHGQGFAIYAGFYVGLSYFDSAIPRKPVCRGSTDASFNHWIPTEFNEDARMLLASAVDDPTYSIKSPRAVTSSNPLVTVGMVVAKGLGVVMLCTNWAGQALAGFKLSLLTNITFSHATLASGGSVAVSSDRTAFVFDLADDADALILR